MRAAEGIRVAVGALLANRLRSILTMIGVVIGVWAVVVLVAIGQGARQEVESEISGLGANLIFVLPGDIQQFGTAPAVSPLQLEDIDLLGRVTGNDRGVVGLVSSGANVRQGAAEIFATVNGANENVPLVFDRQIARGSYFRAADIDTRRRVAVLGSTVAQALFSARDPLGKQVSINGVRFRVIGVFVDQGTTFGVDRNREVHVPITTAQRLFGVERVDAFAVKAASREGIEAVQRNIVSALEDKYQGQSFSAVTQTQILGTVGRILNLLTLILAAIAGISLLVGGVGVSNIMLVSVRERTREIGLRKALGARQRDVLVQFLAEAVLLTTIGGLIGILVGISTAITVERFSPLPAVIAWWSIALAFGVSIAVGIFFGVAPARRAGRLDPVVALRSE